MEILSGNDTCVIEAFRTTRGVDVNGNDFYSIKVREKGDTSRKSPYSIYMRTDAKEAHFIDSAVKKTLDESTDERSVVDAVYELGIGRLVSVSFDPVLKRLPNSSNTFWQYNGYQAVLGSSETAKAIAERIVRRAYKDAVAFNKALIKTSSDYRKYYIFQPSNEELERILFGDEDDEEE